MIIEVTRPIRVPTFVFDLAGVLVDWQVEPLYLPLFGGDVQALRAFFRDVFTADRMREICLGRPILEVIDELTALHPASAEPIRAWHERWDEMVTGPIDGTVEISRELRARGHLTYLLGNWSREEFDRASTRFACLGEFSGAVIAGDHGYMKPDAALFEIAIRNFGLEPRDTVFIDDSAGNVDAAIAIGLRGIVFESPEQLRRTLSENGHL